MGDLTNKTLKGRLADEKVGRLLVTTNLAKRDGPGPITAWLLDTSSSGGRLASCLGGKLLMRSLASCGPTGGLFGTSHV